MTNIKFSFSRSKTRLFFAGIVLFCAVMVIGCRSLPRSGIDRSGDRLFESCPLQDIFPSDCRLFGQGQNQNQNQDQGREVQRSAPVSIDNNVQSNVSSNLSSSFSSSSLPGNFGSSSGGVLPIQNYGSTATAVNPNIHGVNTAVVPADGVNGLRPCFEDSGGYVVATGAIERPSLLVSPVEQIAPVGSEVVLIASYLGHRDRLITNEKVEWNLEGVGSFLKFDQGSYCDPLLGDFVKARKITERFIVTKTSRLYQTLNRGTPETRDDLHILQGQTWVSLNSLREGTSHVTAFAPSLSNWSRRTMFGMIHWVDAQWVIPVLPVSPVGESRVLTTSVLRRTNGQPRQGWIVRYEILSGPSAGLGSTMAQIQEVTTDVSGQATVVLSQREPLTGTNTISVQIIRPAGSNGGSQDGAGDKRITVGYETLRQTWSGAANVRVRIKGPEQGKSGADLPYKIIVTNNMSNNAEGVLTLAIPPAAVFVRSEPPVYARAGQILYWNVDIPAKSTVDVDVVLRQGIGGTLMLESNFTPGGRVNISNDGTQTSITNPNQIYPNQVNPNVNSNVNPNRNLPPVNLAPVAPATPDNVTNNNGGGIGGSVHVWGDDSVTIHGAPSKNTNLTPDTTNNFDQLKLSMAINPKTPLNIGEGFEILFTLENRGNIDVRNAVLQIPIPVELRNLERYRFSGLKELRDSKTIMIDPMFNIVQNFNVIEAGRTVTMRVGFPTLLPAGYSVVGELLINGKLVKRTQPLRIIKTNERL
ncbi:MAG: hypothetical protein LBP59_18560 [Planctomycetaceae bacterium]|jgi:hypothetical protein|nr:hypothetical protein [Planctomycetaceae bacterium]